MRQTFMGQEATQPVIRSIRVGSVDWSVLVRRSGSSYECSGVSLDGHVLRTCAMGSSHEAVQQALAGARAIEWIDLRGRSWEFALEVGHPEGAKVHVDLDGTRVGSVSIPVPVTLTSLGSDRLLEILFLLAGGRENEADSDGLSIRHDERTIRHATPPSHVRDSPRTWSRATDRVH